MGNLNNGNEENTQHTDTGAILRKGREVLLQGFNWESHKNDWWKNLDRKVSDIAKSGFTSMKQYKVRAMADIVINHRIGTTQGHGGRYSVKYVKEYVEEAKPLFSVGEYWDSCNYNGVSLDYHQDRHRQRIINWIDGTGQLSAAFDFTTKGILQEAVKGQLWRLRDPKGKPPGVMGWWPSRALTFLDNHDTDSTQAHWPFPANHIMESSMTISMIGETPITTRL